MSCEVFAPVRTMSCLRSAPVAERSPGTSARRVPSWMRWSLSAVVPKRRRSACAISLASRSSWGSPLMSRRSSRTKSSSSGCWSTSGSAILLRNRTRSSAGGRALTALIEGAGLTPRLLSAFPDCKMTRAVFDPERLTGEPASLQYRAPTFPES